MKSSKYAVEMVNITKTFSGGAIIANKDLTLKVKRGEILALVGENGAGKSTLMSILFGMYQPASGEIFINGERVNITSPVKANELGIGMVHQHFKLVEANRVWENIALGVEDTKGGIFLNSLLIKQQINEIMKQYDLYVDLNAKIKDISVGMQQRVEILKILYREADILVFDEPTAILTPNEIDSLLEIMKNLKKLGKTIIFITHKLDEIMQVADEAVVIRKGKNVETFVIKDITGPEISEAMVGRKLVEVKNKKHSYDKKNPILEIINLTVKQNADHRINAVEGLNLTVHAGEILAIAGVAGNGQEELVEAITGLTKPSSGAVLFKSLNITNVPISERYSLGVNHIPEDRHRYGMILDFSVLDNIILQSINQHPFSKSGIINNREIAKYGRKIISDYDVRGSRNGMAIGRVLSGGNQQKLVVGREIVRHHELLVVVQPTRGLDVGAIEFIHSQIIAEKAKKKAVLLVSYELSEVMALADNIAVINEGKIVDIIPAKGAKRSVIGNLMAGNKKKAKGKRHEK